MKIRTVATSLAVVALLGAGGWWTACRLAGQPGAPAVQPEPAVARAFPARDPATPPQLIDLSAYYNDSLETGWQHQLMPGNNLATLPQGRQVLDGVEFDVPGIVQLTSRKLQSYATATNFPESIEGIVIGRTCQRLHFLHATGWDAIAGTSIGSYWIRYANNREVEIPIRFGREIGNWWAMPSDIAKRPQGVVWQGTNAANQPVQLFRKSWRNPYPAVEIRSVDFVSRMTRSAPFLIAITAE